MKEQTDWSVRYPTLLCNNCKKYWQDLKYCPEHEIFTFDKEKFDKIQTNKCLEKVKEDNINMCNLTRREIV